MFLSYETDYCNLSLPKTCHTHTEHRMIWYICNNHWRHIFRITGPLCSWVKNHEAGDLRCHRGHYGGWSPWLYFRVCIFGFCMSFPFTEEGAVALSPSMAMTVSVLCRRLSFNSLRPNDAYMRRKMTRISSDNGLAPEQRQAIIWTNTEILLIGPLGTNFSKISIEIQTFSWT